MAAALSFRSHRVVDDYSNDIQLGIRWADAPAFRFDTLSEERARAAVLAVTAPVDVVAEGRALTRHLPPQPLLTCLFNLGYAVSLLRRDVCRRVVVPLEPTTSRLVLARNHGELRLQAGTDRPSGAMPFEQFDALLERRVRELLPTLERLPNRQATRIFAARVHRWLAHLTTTASPLVGMRESSLFSLSATLHQGPSGFYTGVLVDEWEAAHRSPREWMGEVVVQRAGGPATRYGGFPLAWLEQAVDNSPRTPLSPLRRVSASGGQRPVLADAGDDASAQPLLARFDIAAETDERRALLSHIEVLARNALDQPLLSDRAFFRSLARGATHARAALLSRIQPTFVERRDAWHEIASTQSPIDPLGIPSPAGRGAPTAPPPRPFAARSVRRLTFERRWSLTIPTRGALIDAAADRERLLLSFDRRLVVVPFAEPEPVTWLSAPPGERLRHEDLGSLRVVALGARRWSRRAASPTLRAWPACWGRSTPSWAQQMEDGTLFARFGSDAPILRSTDGASSESLAVPSRFRVLDADRSAVLGVSADRRVQLHSFEVDGLQWSSTEISPHARGRLDRRLAVLAEPVDAGSRVLWIERESGLVVWSSDLPPGQLRTLHSPTGLVVAVTGPHGEFHAIRLDELSGHPGLVARVRFREAVTGVDASAEGLLVHTPRETHAVGLHGRVQQPLWSMRHPDVRPSHELRWAVTDDVLVIAGERLVVIAIDTGSVLFEVDAFWEELEFLAIDRELQLVAVERRSAGELVVHRLRCAGFLAPVR